MRALSVALAFAMMGGLSACTFDREGAPELHYADFKGEPPRKNSVWLCHAYGCQQKTKVTFGAQQLSEIAALMAKTKKADTPHEERRAIAYATAYMYVWTGNLVGTIKDRPGMDYEASGDPTQMDCVDHSTNTTSFLLVLQNNGLLKHHTVGRPFAKGNILQGVGHWPHWTAVLTQNDTKVRWAVDSWVYAIGENPIVIEADKWYNVDLDNMPKGTT
ncbi:hypothetical protein Rvan_1601 [Rhodomicrobium vannielii ATCC 17100]|uniref:Lipoprotein n=1 Tax=Rhodomicrobium vannielii (strain ATCC 17100 / DSM 162 / LMG 4299 / NCIMB 10020 / ATH 3.1.1) TaxID=648757 RepID=E3I8E4_RHOVT|nr:hypothetical protein [Rhodomicrobium vannielii]ADP70853.1 hypothetical protein Rvan_1601 [Rhodomicrobium vannielii ATCC 17100]